MRTSCSRLVALAVGLAIPAAAFAQQNVCANATLITPGTYAGTTVGSTNDGQSGCGSSNTSPDVWYKIIPPTDRRLVITTCGGAGWDTVLAIHSGCPGTTSNVLACNDDSCGLQSSTAANVTGGQTYLIRVAGYNGATGAFTLTVTLEDPPPPPTNGPDVTVHNLIDMAYYGNLGGINAYAIGTDACNVGDAPVAWYNGTPFHPVIAQNMYRLKNGRFEQIGLSFLKHGFSSTNSPGCGTCISPPDGGQQLGIACTDAYGSGLNGSQGNLGPRSEVNATNGVYQWPFGGAAYSGAIARRLQVLQDDVNPALNAGALYFAECQYVTQDDAQWNNGLNNNTWRRITIASTTATPAFAGASVVQQAAINAWAANDASVTLVNADYLDNNIVSRFIVGSKVTSNGNGTWTYEYAIQNINAHRSAGSVAVSVPQAVSVSDVGFHDVFYHSGEPYAGTDWPWTKSGNTLTWATQTFAQNQNANALRWSTLYNYRFTANQPPVAGTMTIGLFRPGTPDSVTVAVPTPATPPPSCDPDVNCDGAANGVDVEVMELAVGGDLSDFCQPDADFNGDGAVNGTDVEAVELVVGGEPCP
ncbi:MAG: hypothetical protein HBSAPP03_28860 [Phycisphaerae bacterium]|nr:MAG: hypothetical protein HBSAPP03_28860 [Phycisphaerae bacterium]